MGEAVVLSARRAARTLVFGALMAGVACDDTNVIPVEVATVEVTPPSATMLAGESQVFQATPRGPDGDVLSGRFVTWTSGDAEVATVSSGGDVEARGEGETTITATIEGIADSSDLTVLQGPEIRLDPATVGFNAFAGDDDIPSQSVDVVNASPNGTVAGLEMFIEYLDGGATGWLAGSRLNGTTAPTTVTVQPNGFGLGEGTYTAEIEVHSTTAVNSPQVIQVNLSLGQPVPRIGLSQTTAEFSIPRFTPSSVPHPPIDVLNIGGGQLSGLSTGIEYTSGVGGWLTATLDETTAPTELRLVARATFLNTGTYRATVEVRSNLAINSPQRVFVTLNVTP